MSDIENKALYQDLDNYCHETTGEQANCIYCVSKWYSKERKKRGVAEIKLKIALDGLAYIKRFVSNGVTTPEAQYASEVLENVAIAGAKE